MTTPEPERDRTIRIAFRPGLPYDRQKTVIGLAKELAKTSALMDRLPLPHIKVAGADRCPSCGCPVADFDKVPCK